MQARQIESQISSGDNARMWWRTPWLQQRWLLLSLALCDALLLIGSYNLLFWHRFGSWAALTGSSSTLIILWLSASYLLGRYSRPDPGQRDSHSRRLATTLVVGGLVLVLVVVVVNWGLKIDDPRTFRGFVLPVLSSATLCSGIAQLWITSHQNRPRHWLLLGSAHELKVLEKELARDPCSNLLRISLCISDNLSEVPSSSDQQIDGIAVSEACSLEDGIIEELLARRGRGVTVYSLVSWSEQHLQRVPPELFSSRWLVQAEGFELQPGRWGWRVKRLGDVVVATILLLLSLPLMMASALAIRWEDGGPALYGQIRTGLYGEPYRIWKLRSMQHKAEPNGAQWARYSDARITRVGGWLRKLRIDELPQLVAVLRGEMSLIGPRPERPELETQLESDIPHYRVRHWIRPGLSGWAQVCFPYGASVADSRVKLSYDLYYLRNASLLLDLLILIKTIRLISRGNGAQPNPNQPSQ
jgi:exopolysaccharide biosynthesis polyprenyl glycosylphosphotransferase